MADSFAAWFFKHDPSFGMRIRKKEPREQGMAICARYGFDFSQVENEYETLGKEEADGLLLARLNNLTE